MVTFRSADFRKSIPVGSIQAYGFAAICVAAAALIRWAIGSLFDGVVPFATFFPAALFAALVGGIGPGTFAAVAGGIIGWWAFLDVPATFFPLTLASRVSLVAYLITSLIVVWGGDHYRKLNKRLEDEESFRQLAVEELAHRLKNKIATIQSIVSLRLREDPQTRDEILSCFASLKSTDDLIIAAQGKGAPIRDIISAELRPYDVGRISISGPNILLPPKLALMMALLFHELATNAAKYGALSSPRGKISVYWSHAASALNLEWRESDGPPVAAPAHRGFGTRLFSRALEQFGGRADATFGSAGLVCNLRVPVSDITSTDDVAGPVIQNKTGVSGGPFAGISTKCQPS